MAFAELVVLGFTSGTVHRVDIARRTTSVVYGRTQPCPDGVVVDGDTVYWTTMGLPCRDPAVGGEEGFDFSRRNGGVQAARIDGTGFRDVVAPGGITTGKQLATDGAGRLYWSDREGRRISRSEVDGTGRVDLIVNPVDEDPGVLGECVGVAVDAEHGWLYWTQKGPAKGGRGRIFRSGLDIPAGQTAENRTDIEVLWDGLPEPIDLEIHEGMLYWTDRGARPLGNTLNRALLPGPGKRGGEPEILADGFAEAIGLAVDGDAGLVYVSDLGGRIRSVPLPGSSTVPAGVLIELGEPLTGIAGR